VFLHKVLWVCLDKENSYQFSFPCPKGGMSGRGRRQGRQHKTLADAEVTSQGTN
jgi:hypothetical protein